MPDDLKWTPAHFQQGEHYLEDPDLNEQTVTVTVKVGGRTLIDMKAREPGILAIVSRPDEDGIRVYTVEAGAVRYVDTQNGVVASDPPEPWALTLLDVE